MRPFKVSDVWSMSPWSANPTMPNIPGVEIPRATQAPRAPRVKRQVPGVDELYDIQKDLIKVINFLKHHADKHPDHIDTDFKRAMTNAKNSYRILVRYLNRYDKPGGGSF